MTKKQIQQVVDDVIDQVLELVCLKLDLHQEKTMEKLDRIEVKLIKLQADIDYVKKQLMQSADDGSGILNSSDGYEIEEGDQILSVFRKEIQKLH